MALHGSEEIHHVDADLGMHELMVIHEGAPEHIHALLRRLNLGAELVESISVSRWDDKSSPSGRDEARTLKIVLAINAAMFATEMIGASRRQNWPARNVLDFTLQEFNILYASRH